jgi:hypothetical protein
VIRLDALAWRRESAKNDGAKPTPHIEITPGEHEEPTWEVRHPRDGRRRRLDGRTRAILSGAAAAAIVVNAGAAWTYWRITGSKTGLADGGTVIEMTLRARSDLTHPLLAGQTGNLTVTVTNDYNYPIRITSITAGTGNAVADDEHREAGCKDPGVAVTQPRFGVSWEVPRNTIGAFTIPDGLAMQAGADSSCAGAVFTLPIRASGTSRRPS